VMQLNACYLVAIKK